MNRKPIIPQGRKAPGVRERSATSFTQKKAATERESPFGEKVYWVDSLSAVREYLLANPLAVKKIESFPERKECEKLLGLSLPQSCEFLKKTGSFERNRDGVPIRAQVAHEVWPEDVLYRDLQSPAFGSVREKRLVLALDHLTDPRNLGAIIRSCAFFGIREVIAPVRRQVLLTQASVATAMGGFALTKLYGVVNLVRSLREMKEQGFWLIGADHRGQALTEAALDFEKSVLILGSEESGMQRLVKEECDLTVSISGAARRVESLNVSVAGGILMSHLCQL
jgi:predicted rRNA methylase